MAVILSRKGGGSAGGGGSPTGAAGGDLAGSYPNPTIGAAKVDTPELADGAVTDDKIDSTGAGSGEVLIADGAGGVSWSPFDPVPSAPVAGYQAWYDAADVASLTIVSNKVSAWADQSANNHDLAQATAGVRPLYNGTPRTINGIICPEFTTGGLFLESTCPADDRTSTTFVVGVLDDISANRTLVGDTQGGGNELRHQGASANVQTLKSTVGVLATTQGVQSGSPFVLMQRMDATTIQTSVGGSSLTVSEASTFTAATTLRLGMDTSGTVLFDGLCGEFIRYASTLSDADAYANFLYLINKWFVP